MRRLLAGHGLPSLELLRLFWCLWFFRGLGNRGLGFRVEGIGFRAWGFEGIGFRVYKVYKVYRVWFRVYRVRRAPPALFVVVLL